MQLLHRLFSPQERTTQSLKELEDDIAIAWQSYLFTLPKKQEELAHWRSDTTDLYRLLDTAILSINNGKGMLNEATRDLHIRSHARHIHSLDRLYTGLYDFETRHEYVRGVLAHLYAVLTAEMQLIQLYNTHELGDEGFIRSFQSQLDYEQQLVERITELVKSFPKITAELLQGVRSEKPFDFNTEAMYQQLVRHLDSYFRGYDTDAQLAEEVDAVVQHLREWTQHESGTYDPEKLDAYEDRWHDLDVYLLNRPEFIEFVQKVLEHHHQKPLPAAYVHAFVAAFREGFHELARQYTHPRK